MLDRKFIVENVDAVKQNCVNRGLTADVDRFVELDSARKAKQAEADDLNRRANEVSKSIGKAKDAEEREARKEEGRQLREQRDAAQQELDGIVAEAADIWSTIPNMAHAEAPVGVDDKANLEVRRGKTAP